jgi:hypothetical protein
MKSQVYRRVCIAIAALLAASTLFVCIYYLGIADRFLLYRYGLTVDWKYGASSTVPTAVVTAKWKGRLVKCPFYFGGIENPELHISNLRWAGSDIVFGNERMKIIISFKSGTVDTPPGFKLIEDNTQQHLND